jgi:uncharacterized protein
MPDPASHTSARPLLSTDWLDLVILNYEVDASILTSHVPADTRLDTFHSICYVSLVGLRFERTRLFGFFRAPFHTAFDEVNLRFYVRREIHGEIRRGVVFIREIAPKIAVVQLANFLFSENYVCLPMKHSIARNALDISAEYSWRQNENPGTKWSRLYARARGAPVEPGSGSFEQFITEHYWGYNRRPSGGSNEYRVHHDPWRVWRASESAFDADTERLYGPAFARALGGPPHSAFIADGGPVLIFPRHPTT